MNVEFLGKRFLSGVFSMGDENRQVAFAQDVIEATYQKELDELTDKDESSKETRSSSDRYAARVENKLSRRVAFSKRNSEPLKIRQLAFSHFLNTLK